MKKTKPVLDFTTTADSYSKKECEKTSKMTIFKQKNQNRIFGVRVETLQMKHMNLSTNSGEKRNKELL